MKSTFSGTLSGVRFAGMANHATTAAMTAPDKMLIFLLAFIPRNCLSTY
jgi:hypothetical protein